MRTDFYEEQMKEDIRDYLRENYEDYKDCKTKDELCEKLHDDLWVVDEVTGNATKYYGYTEGDQELAQEYIAEGHHHLREAIRDFCCEEQAISWFLEGDYISLDATIRCYLLGQVLGEQEKENFEFLKELLEND